jgi:hypothetical protein
MNDEELDRLLRAVPEPERTEAYWTEFPGQVQRLLVRAAEGPGPVRLGDRTPKWRWQLAWGAAVIAVGIGVGIGRREEPAQPAFSRGEILGYREVWREVTALFPHQVRAIIFEPGGPRLILAEQANLPAEPALLVRECSAAGCRTALTFSGQSVQLGDQRWDVLTDSRGAIIVAGESTAWPLAPGGNRISAQPLEASL